MEADRQRAAEAFGLRSALLSLYVFSCSEHLTKDNLFGCLKLQLWLVEDYMRWTSDLWGLLLGWSTNAR